MNLNPTAEVTTTSATSSFLLAEEFPLVSSPVSPQPQQSVVLFTNSSPRSQHIITFTVPTEPTPHPASCSRTVDITGKMIDQINVTTDVTALESEKNDALFATKRTAGLHAIRKKNAKNL